MREVLGEMVLSVWLCCEDEVVVFVYVSVCFGLG